MLTYHKNGVTLTLELPSVDDLALVQDGLTIALQRLSEVAPESQEGTEYLILTRLLAATLLTPDQQRQAQASLRGAKTAA